MKTKLMGWLMMVAMLCWFCMDALGATGNSTLGGANAYNLRGRVYNDEAVLQPSFDVTAPNGLGLVFWENFDLTDYEGAKNEATEMDATLRYTRELGHTFWGELGISQYAYPNIDAEETTEAYLTIGSTCRLQPSVGAWWDFNEVDGFYGQFGVSPYIPFADKFKLGVQGTLGWASGAYNEYYFGTDEAALNDMVGKVWLSWQISKSFSFRAEGGWMYLPDDSVRDAAENLYGHGDAPLFGASLTYSF